jgi:hypothetical protein
LKKVFVSTWICFALIAGADTNAGKKELDFRDKVTSGYHTILNSVDCFITNYDDVNQSNYKKISKNKLYIILSLKNTKDNPLQKDLHLRGSIKLPRLQNKVEITFNKQAEKRVDNQHIDNDYEEALNDTNLHVGLKYYAYDKPYSNAYAKLSLKFHSPVGLYAKIGMNKSYFYHKLQTTFNHALYYYIHDKEYAASSSVTFFLPFKDLYSIEQKNRLYWEEKDKIAMLWQILRLYHDINVQNRLQYQLTYATIDDEVHNYRRDWYGANIKFRHNINNWLFFEIIPEVLKRRENHFEYEKVVTVNFGLTLSK